MSVSQQALNRIHKFGIVQGIQNTSTSPAPAARGMSAFDTVKACPPDAIFGVKAEYSANTNPNKQNLTVGAYRTNEGKPYMLKIVRQVQSEIADDPTLNKEYLPIHGDAEFTQLAQGLALGKDFVATGRVGGVQSLSGTGALRLLFEFLSKNFPGSTVFISNPTWGNHKKVIRESGLKQTSYRYYNPKTLGLDFPGFCEDVKGAPDGSIFLLHACAHNPTGVDPTQDQWKQLCELFKAKRHIAFFDSAYQGYATGDLEKDAFAMRYFANQGVDMVLAQSFAKNLGLYGERVGTSSVICQSPESARACVTQLKAVVRPMYSNPPRHGAEITKRILRDPANYAAWNTELKYMSNRILEMRQLLFDNLNKLDAPSPSGNWNHVMNQIGMFCFTGLTKAQVMYVREKYAVYLLGSGRISVAGVNTGNVQYLAQAFNDALRNA